MKEIISKIVGLAVLLSLSACSEFFDINETPNNPVSVPPNVLLSTGLAGTAFANSNELNRFASTIMSVTAGAGGSPAAYDIYNIDGSDFLNQWRFEIFNGALINYDELIKAADRDNSPVYKGIAKIMKAYTFALTTDIWGDIPYSEALKGADKTQPKLDSQEVIYLGKEGVPSLFDLVKEGLQDLESSSSLVPGKDDLVYGGDLEKWKKAGYSIMLKMANTISQVKPDEAKKIIEEVLAAGNFIEENSQNLNVKFGTSVGSRSPINEWTNVSLFRNDMMISTRFVNLLQGKNDPRLPFFVTKPTGSYVTIDNGFRGTLPQPQSSWSRFNAYVTGREGEGPTRLITHAQISFILAESALVLGTAGNPEEFFQKGIMASMRDAGLSLEEIADYFQANPEEVSLNGSLDENLEKIIVQKYIAQFGNGLEQWNDYRRTGYPQLEDHQNAVGIDGTRPVRAQYTNEEIARNPNFEVVLPNVKVWWDVD
jgi:hypothetical protein